MIKTVNLETLWRWAITVELVIPKFQLVTGRQDIYVDLVNCVVK